MNLRSNIIGEIKTKSGESHGILTVSDIDLDVDYRTFFTMYSAIMHDVKRYGYKEAYELWTDAYERLINDADFIGKLYCLRAGEAIRYYCSQKSGSLFAPKFYMSGNEKWVVSCLYLDETTKGVHLDEEFIEDLQMDISSVEDCFASYNIAFTEVDMAV